MGGGEELFKEAKKEFTLADHIFSVALSVVKDKNVFLSILTHLDKSIYLTIRAYLYNQRKQKRIRIIPESKSLAKRLFFEEFTASLGITTSEYHILKELNQLVKAHQKNQAEIKRGDNYIIFLPNFETVTVNENNIKRYLSISRSFISKVEKGMKNGTR